MNSRSPLPPPGTKFKCHVCMYHRIRIRYFSLLSHSFVIVIRMGGGAPWMKAKQIKARPPPFGILSLSLSTL